jgi:polysaccharide export outer membrane protein
MKKEITAVFAFLLLSVGAMAQAKAPAADVGVAAQPAMPGPDDRLRLAASSASYPVTPGDVYTLTFQQGGAPTTLEILVGSDSSVQLSAFGKMNAEGMTFSQVKQNIEKAFVAAYPRSIPYLSIKAVGVFQVFLKGEIAESQNVDAWGMSRLSDVIQGKLDPYSSLRDIKIISRTGNERTCDLFQYLRFGDVSQNPFMKAGDTVVISPSARTIEVLGEVRRPGRYQLLPSEQLTEVINNFGGGLTAAAEGSQVRIDRVEGAVPRTLYVNLADPAKTVFSLQDGDVVTVPSKTAELPVAYFEGAVAEQAAPAAPGAVAGEAPAALPPATYSRLPYRFRQGETLKSALMAVRKSILPTADLTEAFVVREGEPSPIPVDLASLLSDSGTAVDMLLRPMDRIVIPTAQFSVSVVGDVTKPGSYPYSPSKKYRYYADLAGFADVEEIPQNIVILDSQGKRRDIGDSIQPGSRIYLTAARVSVQGAVMNPGNFPYRKDFSVYNYLNLAGGFDPERSNNGRSVVLDLKGNARKEKDPIQPGDRIFVYSDKFSYNFSKGFPVFVSFVALVATGVTIYALLK